MSWSAIRVAHFPSANASSLSVFANFPPPIAELCYLILYVFIGCDLWLFSFLHLLDFNYVWVVGFELVHMDCALHHIPVSPHFWVVWYSSNSVLAEIHSYSLPHQKIWCSLSHCWTKVPSNWWLHSTPPLYEGFFPKIVSRAHYSVPSKATFLNSVLL